MNQNHNKIAKRFDHQSWEFGSTNSHNVV